MSHIYVNGALLPEESASLPARDRGLLFGDGIFETVRAYRGEPFRLADHFERLRDSAVLLRLGLPLDLAGMAAAIDELLEVSGLKGDADAYVRITLTAGVHQGGFGLQRRGPANLVIAAQPYEALPPSHYSEGIRLIVSDIRRNSGSPVSRIKSLNYLDSLLAREEAIEAGADEAILLDGGERLAETSSSNLFFAAGDLLRTPSLDCGALPGTARRLVLELCERDGIAAEEGRYRLADLNAATEVFLCNSLRQLVPVREVAGLCRFDPVPGAVTTRLMNAYAALTGSPR
ncbi:MAG: aminotransferase class IV [Candidatus Geothermincolia bacterium]